MFLSNTYLISDFICFTLSLADTHGIARYARTYIRRYTHNTHKTPKKVGKVGAKKRKGKKEKGVREERKKREK